MTIQKEALPLQRPHSQPLIRPYPLLNGCVLALLPIRGDKWHDFSPQENHGTFISTGFGSQGRFGPGVYLDGSANYVTVADHASLNINGAIAIEMWMKLPAYDVQRDIVGKIAANRYNYHIVTFAGNRVRFQIYDGTDNPIIYSVTQVLDDSWHHILVSRGPGNYIYLYVDGKSDTTRIADTCTGTITNTADLYIGKDIESSHGKGTIDLLGIYDRHLLESDAKYLYELGRPY